jgi:hypothetical protein
MTRTFFSALAVQLIPLILILGFGMWLTNKIIEERNKHIVELPEEYKLINKNDTLKGVFRNDTLFIEFNNKRN